jgi:hypothetical protein
MNLVGEPKFILARREAFFDTSLEAFRNPRHSLEFSVQEIVCRRLLDSRSSALYISERER